MVVYIFKVSISYLLYALSLNIILQVSDMNVGVSTPYIYIVLLVIHLVVSPEGLSVVKNFWKTNLPSFLDNITETQFFYLRKKIKF